MSDSSVGLILGEKVGLISREERDGFVELLRTEDWIEVEDKRRNSSDLEVVVSDLVLEKRAGRSEALGGERAAWKLEGEKELTIGERSDNKTSFGSSD